MNVLDASALLALVHREEGAAPVRDALLHQPFMSTVNIAEVASTLAESGVPDDEIREVFRTLTITPVDFDEDLAYRVGMLRPLTRAAGLSLGDRACLALAQRLGLPALTADRRWAGIDAGVQVIVVR